MRACPHCGRPVESESVVPSVEPPAWLDEEVPGEPSPRQDVGEPVVAGDVGSGESTTHPSPVPHDEFRDERLGAVDHDAVDPLDGWDLEPGPVGGDPVASDGLFVLAAAAAGLVVGAAVSASRARGAVAGALAGSAAAVSWRRMWRIDGPDDGWALARGRRDA